MSMQHTSMEIRMHALFSIRHFPRSSVLLLGGCLFITTGKWVDDISFFSSMARRDFSRKRYYAAGILLASWNLRGLLKHKGSLPVKVPEMLSIICCFLRRKNSLIFL
ncbi:hypothetical protein VTH06DRAFT_6085 [Thermothelomyces fergusii]